VRIAYLYPQWKPGRNSYAMDVLGRTLARDIAQDHDVTLLSRGRGRETGAGPPLDLVGYGLDRVLAPLAHRIWPIAERMRLVSRSKPISSTIWGFPGYAMASARKVRQIEANIAHVHIYEQLVPLIRQSSPRTRIVLHVHDHSQLQQEESTVRRRLEMADLIVGCSEYMAGAVAERFPSLSERVIAIPNSIPEPWHEREPIDHGGAIVFVGRLSPEKGVHVLVEAFNEIGRRHPHATLTVVGPSAVPGASVVQSHLELPAFEPVHHFYGRGDAYRRHLRDLVTPDLRDRVDFAGELPNEEATKKLLSADVLVMPSIWNEPFGMPVLEGMAARLPVVATNVGAFPDTVADGETGLLVAPGEVADLAGAIESMIADPATARAMGEAGRRRAATRFGWQQYVESWSNAYADLARDDGRAGR